jgi:fumarylpyruvate hydrolase
LKLAIEAPPLHTLAIASRDERFPGNRVFCVGRNYAAHAREMGKDPDREPPFFFMKPANAVVAGDVMLGAIQGLGTIEVRVTP